MDERDSPYIFREEQLTPPRQHDPEEREVIIIDGQAMSFRSYRR